MKISDIVAKALNDDPQARSDDRKLLLGVWAEQGLILLESQRSIFMYQIASSETIRRIRQKLQEQGKYVAAEPIRRHRKFRGLQVQQAIPKTKPEKIDQLINSPPEQQSLIDVPPARKRYV